jgi:protein-tyrosine-phosphatase
MIMSIKIQGKKEVLFLCTHNSARSQMAEGLLRAFYGERCNAHSAGTKPTFVDPRAVLVMKEIGIDISDQYSKSVEEFYDTIFDMAVTVCDRAKQACPICSTRLELPSNHPEQGKSFTEALRTLHSTVDRRKSSSRSSGGSETRFENG